MTLVFSVIHMLVKWGVVSWAGRAWSIS